MAVTYLRLFDPTQQFQLKNGAINVAGLLKVKLEGTDDWAPVFDENGTQLQQPVILDNNGRSKGLFVDASKVYWLEVDDRDGYELFTIRKMTPCGGGTGSILGGSYDVQSTDGTVNVTRYDNGGVTTFDLSIATQSEESKWGATFGTVASVTGDGTWEQVPAWTSAGSVSWNNGWEATKDCVADIAASLEMTSGDSDAITTLDVMCSFSVDGTVVSTEYGMLDPSEPSGRVTFEYKGEVLEGQKIDCRFSVKGDEAMTPVLVGRAYYNEECDGIVGGENQGTTYIPGDYVEITTADVINVTGLQPLSGMSSYAYQSSLDNCCSSMSSVVSSIQNDVSSISSVVSGITGATGNYVEKSSISAESATWNTVSSKVDQSAFDNCCSAMSGYVSSLQNDVSSISSTVSGLTGQYVEISSISGYSSTWNSASAISSKLDESAFTAYTSTATGFFTGVVTDSSLTGDGTPGSALGVNKMELVFDSSMETSVSGNSAIVGVNTAIMSGYMPTGASSDFILTSQSGAFQPSGNYQPSGDYLSSTDSSNFILTSQSGAFQPSGNYASSSDITGFVYASSISAESAVWNSASAVSGKLDESAFTSYTATATGFFTGVSTDSSLTGNGTPGSALGVNRMELIFDSSMTTSVNDGSATVGVNTAILSGKLDASAISSYALSADVSSCIDTVSSNSASWGGGATGDYVEKSAIEVTIGDSNTALDTAFAQGSANSAERYSLVQGYGNSALQCSMAQGYDNLADHWSIAQGTHSTSYSDSLAQGYYNSAYSHSFAQGGRISASGSSMAQGYYNSAFNVSFAQGMYLSAVNTAAVFGISNLRGNGDTATGDSAAFVIGDGWESSTGRHDLMVVTKDGEITLFSSTADTTGTGIMSSLRHISANYQPSGDYIYASSLGTGTI